MVKLLQKDINCNLTLSLTEIIIMGVCLFVKTTSFRIFFFTFCFLFSTIICGFGQDSEDKFYSVSYVEGNLGIAKAFEFVDYGLGFSFSKGEYYVYKDKFIFDWEIGLAIPTILTAKLGVGLLIKECSYIVGVRPYPSTIFFQIGFPPTEYGYLFLSIEYNPRPNARRLTGLSYGNINLGYRRFRY